jgi:hypothetical protein
MGKRLTVRGTETGVTVPLQICCCEELQKKSCNCNQCERYVGKATAIYKLLILSAVPENVPMLQVIFPYT